MAKALSSALEGKRRARVHDKNPQRHAERDDDRTRYQRDRDRVLYSPAFRRLAGITQVVHSGEGHVFHNRMTHSLKVGQVARRLAEYILGACKREQLDVVGGLDPDVAETAGLCHDIGHPPFGHAAEWELQDLFEKEIKEEDGFEGNAQSFRIVTKVSRRDLLTPGLDLTAASLAAIVKYPWSRGPKTRPARHKKFGYYQSEVNEFRVARSFLPKDDERQSLEAAIMDWADDVSYAVHDIDDAFRAGLVPIDRLYTDDAEQERFVQWYALEQIRRAAAKKETKADREAEEKALLGELDARKNAIAETIGMLADLPYAPRRPFGNTHQDIGALHRYSSVLLTRYLTVSDDTLVVNLKKTSDQPRLIVNKALKEQVALLKDLMVFYVYESPALVAQQQGQRAVVRELFLRIFEATEARADTRGLIPRPYRDELDQLHREGRTSLDRDRARLAIDIICSMTEQQALDLYKRLSGLAPGTIRDQIVY